MAAPEIRNKGDLINSLAETPLGQGPGERVPYVPANFRGQQAMVYARNWSSVRPRKIVIDAVSYYRGGDVVQRDQIAVGAVQSLESLHQQARDGVDKSKYAMEIKPIVFTVRFDGRATPVPYHGVDALTGEECDAPHVVIPEGAWDLYVGNWDALHSKNPQERNLELARVSAAWGKFNRVFHAEAPPGEFAYVEFVRIPIPEATTAIDGDRLFPGMLIEG